jgi:hypothetical protein
VGLASVWHGEMFARMKRPPDLDKVLAKRRPGRGSVDRALTSSETRRWIKILAEKKGTPEVTEGAHG